MPIPPAAKELLPPSEVAAFHRWWPIFEDSMYDWQKKQAELRVGYNEKTIERIEKAIEKFGFDREAEKHLWSAQSKLEVAKKRVRNLESAQDEIAYRLSWLDWFKSLPYDKMEEEIKRIERKQYRMWSWALLPAYLARMIRGDDVWA